MIYTYGITCRGRYHDQDNSPCQDAHKIVRKGNLVVAAVADGVGSENCSHIASELAVSKSVDYCMDHLTEPLVEEDVLDVIKDSFWEALQAIQVEAAGSDQYDTTLTLAVYMDGELYYGQSGDSGILALADDGLVEGVTIQQRDDESRVYPLDAGTSKWVFGRYPKKAASVLLVTDGILESLFPSVLDAERQKVYVYQACFFMDDEILRFGECGKDMVENRIRQYLENIVAENISDDLTVVAIVNLDLPIERQPDDYYMLVDWEILKKDMEERRRRILYPHLYKL